MKFDFYNEAKQKINDSLEILVEEDANFVTKLDLFVAKTMANEYFYPAAFFGELKARVLEIQQIETLSHLVKAEGCYYYIYSCLLSMAEKLGFTAHQFDLAFFLLHGNDQQMFINLCKSTGEDAYNISTSAISIFVSFYNWISASYKATVKQDGTFIALNVVFDAVIDAVSKKPNITMKGSKTPASVGGCYVATAVYGSYDCPQVWILRRYRDNYLGSSWFGRAFIRFYYVVSPTMVKWFGKTKWFNRFFKKVLDKKIVKLKNKGYLDTEYQDIDWRKK